MIETIEAEVAVIGSGGAGMAAAIGAYETGAGVVLLGKTGIGKGSCTSMAGGFMGTSSAERSVEEHYRDTLEAGRGLNDERLVKAVVGRARESIGRLKELGLPLIALADGFMVDNRGNAREVPGIPLVESMARLIKERAIDSLEHFHALDLVSDGGRIAGVVGIGAAGEPIFVHAGAVVLATGGASAIYLRNDNPPTAMGAGYAMALRAGCRLQDMEFVQFYPLGISEPGLPGAIIYPPYPTRARVLDAQGRDVLRELPGCRSLHDAIVRFRDAASLLFHRTCLNGGLFLDLTGVEESDWKGMFSMRLLARTGFDFQRRQLRIAPLAHFSIGGVSVDENCRTAVAGLFAAGEVVGGFHGANRRGGNALTECLVFGLMAGAKAAEHALEAGRPRIPLSAVREIVPPWAGKQAAPHSNECRSILERIKSAAWDFAGAVRSEQGMLRGLDVVAGMEGELANIKPAGNADGLLHARATDALLTLRCTLESGLCRRESRGAFCREDFPEQDDVNWRRNISVSPGPAFID